MLSRILYQGVRILLSLSGFNTVDAAPYVFHITSIYCRSQRYYRIVNRQFRMGRHTGFEGLLTDLILRAVIDYRVYTVIIGSMRLNNLGI